MAKLRLAIRIDDPPFDTELGTAENIAYIAEKFSCPLSVAILSGKLRDAPHLHSTYRRLFDKDLLRIACHGMYHEDFSGIGVSWSRGYKPIDEAQADKVVKECQDFARTFFGRPYTLFVVPFMRLPPDPTPIYNLLVENGFNKISNNAIMDPLGEGYFRYEGLYEIPYTMRFDFYHRTWQSGYKPEITFRAAHEPSRYLRAVEDHIRFRFENELYVCLYTHETGFAEKPDRDADYPGGKLAVHFLERVLEWVSSRYPGVELVGMEDLAGES